MTGRSLNTKAWQVIPNIPETPGISIVNAVPCSKEVVLHTVNAGD